MLRRGAGSGIVMGAMLCAIGGGLSLLGSRQHGSGGPQAIYVGIVVVGALRILSALIPQRRSRRRRREAHPQAPASYTTGAPHQTGAPYIAGAPHQTGAPYIAGAPHQTGAPYIAGAPYITGAPHQTGAPDPAATPQVGYSPVKSAPGRCWDCGSRVRLDSAICFHCGAAQVNGYQRSTSKPVNSTTTAGPAPAPEEYPRYQPARPY